MCSFTFLQHEHTIICPLLPFWPSHLSTLTLFTGKLDWVWVEWQRCKCATDRGKGTRKTSSSIEKREGFSLCTYTTGLGQYLTSWFVFKNICNTCTWKIPSFELRWLSMRYFALGSIVFECMSSSLVLTNFCWIPIPATLEGTTKTSFTIVYWLWAWQATLGLELVGKVDGCKAMGESDLWQ